MRDYLYDIVKHASSAFRNIRVDGDDTVTEISATESERQMVIRGKFHKPVPEFKGLFGIPTLGPLGTLLSIPEYQDENAKITLVREVRDGQEQPVAIHFENATGDFKNEFRLMTGKLINAAEPKLKFNVTSWALTFVPSITNHNRLKYQASVHPDEKSVTFKIENGRITAIIGDESSHTGSFVFHTGIDPTLKKNISVPVGYINEAFSVNGDKTIHMDDLGVMISVDSGLANYDYILPMVSK